MTTLPPSIPVPLLPPSQASQLRLTPWFKALDHKPRRNGVYQVYHYLLGEFKIAWAKWDGRNWHYVQSCIDVATRAVGITAFNNDIGFYWRGLVPAVYCANCGRPKNEHHAHNACGIAGGLFWSPVD